jgi:hypothetical protein
MQGSIVSTIIGTSARSQPGNTFNMAGRLANVGVRTRKRCRFFVPLAFQMINHLAARLLGARDGLAIGIAGDFHGDLAVGNLREGLPDDFHRLEQFFAAHGATGVGIAFGARDRHDVDILERGVTLVAHVLRHATGPQCGADAAQIPSFLFGKHAHAAEPCLYRAVIEKTLVMSRMSFSIPSKSVENVLMVSA